MNKTTMVVLEGFDLCAYRFIRMDPRSLADLESAFNMEGQAALMAGGEPGARVSEVCFRNYLMQMPYSRRYSHYL
jgi:hypothetical protein